MARSAKPSHATHLYAANKILKWMAVASLGTDRHRTNEHPKLFAAKVIRCGCRSHVLDGHSL